MAQDGERSNSCVSTPTGGTCRSTSSTGVAGVAGDNLVIGTARELREHFARQHEHDIDRFYVWFADFAPVRTLERFGDVIGAMA